MAVAWPLTHVVTAIIITTCPGVCGFDCEGAVIWSPQVGEESSHLPS